MANVLDIQLSKGAPDLLSISANACMVPERCFANCVAASSTMSVRPSCCARLSVMLSDMTACVVDALFCSSAPMATAATGYARQGPHKHHGLTLTIAVLTCHRHDEQTRNGDMFVVVCAKPLDHVVRSLVECELQQAKGAFSHFAKLCMVSSALVRQNGAETVLPRIKRTQNTHMFIAARQSANSCQFAMLQMRSPPGNTSGGALSTLQAAKGSVQDEHHVRKCSTCHCA